MIDFAALVLGPAMAAFAQPITVTPTASQPGVPSYAGQGVYSLKPVTIEQESGGYHQTFQVTLGIRLADYTVTPVQGDAVLMAQGSFEVFNVVRDGQGGADLQLRAVA